jgi:hypothetical protein
VRNRGVHVRVTIHDRQPFIRGEVSDAMPDLYAEK